MASNDIVVLASGGIDSTVLAHKASRAGRLHSLFFVWWGQPAVAQEREMVIRLGEELRRPVQEFDLPLLAMNMNIGIGKPGPRVIPGRNLAFLAVAINYAASMKCRQVWLGATVDDRDSYPDCRITFIDHLRNITTIAYHVSVLAPFYTKTKADLVDLAKTWGVDLGQTWSCYEATVAGTQCGLCDSCKHTTSALAGRWEG